MLNSFRSAIGTMARGVWHNFVASLGKYISTLPILYCTILYYNVPFQVYSRQCTLPALYCQNLLVHAGKQH